MGAMAGSRTTGSGTPWTAQQFSTWKRREKGRLVKLRGFLEEQFTEDLVPSKLKNQLVEAEARVSALLSEIDGLEKTRGRSLVKTTVLDTDLVHQQKALDDQKKLVRYRKKRVETRFSFQGSKRTKLAEAEATLRSLEAALTETHAANERLKEANERLKAAKDEAGRQLPNTKASFEAAKENESEIRKLFDGLSKLARSVQQGSEMLTTTLSLNAFVDRCLADLETNPTRAWMIEGVTAYVDELGRKEEAKLRRERKLKKELADKNEAKLRRKKEREKELKKELADKHKQLEKDSKELADLQQSESAALKRVEPLERRLERENERLLAERKFIYTKLLNKRRERGYPALTEREVSFLSLETDFTSDGNFTSNRTWASDSKHKDWATKGVEFSAKLRTSARKIKELEADIKELKAVPKRIRALKSSIRQLEKDIATADKANAAAGGWPKGKAPRIGYIANAHAFEKYMAEWMRWLGWDDAKAMPVGPDEGIDVKATGALGQAKHWDAEVGIEEVQRHNGVCEGIQKYGRVFLSKSGYTPQAIKWANDRDLPLFEMKAGSKDAGVVACTKAGEKLLKVGAKAMKGNKRN